MKQITLDENEEKALLSLLDAANRQLGLQAANACATFQNKIENATPVVEKKPRKPRRNGKVVKLKGQDDGRTSTV